MALFSSLPNRIFVAIAVLTVVCTGIAIAVVNVWVTASAEDELRRGLLQAGAVVDQQRATRSDLLIALARLVADLPRLKAAVDTSDPPTVQPVAEEYEQWVDVDLLVVTDATGAVLASVTRGPADVPVPALPTIQEALAGHETGTFWPHPEGLLHVVSVPITVGSAPPEILGTLTAGFLLGDVFAEGLKGLTGSDIALCAGGRIRAGTLPATDGDAFAALVDRPGVGSISVGDSEYLTLARPLSPLGAAILPGSPARLPMAPSAEASDPTVFILRSRTDQLHFLRPIQMALALTGVAAVLLATVLSYGVARTITRPLAAIVATMKEIAATGDLTRRIDWLPGRWVDEDARLLARTFNALTESVAASQREASERERLSALGRLSTVIAHEVRNPLMIIRASLRPLSRASVTAAEIREAVGDIDEEVRRLDRVVNDVLDFARPPRFELALADVNRVAAAAAAAAAGGTGRPAPHLALDPSLAFMVTDAERLRLVLVNLLVNARHAVEARRAREEAVPTLAHDVELTTATLAGGGVAITVRDRGVGIAAADLPRVFDAYFTTNSAGTGLGLAIARSVIEGLGGTIGIRSEPGAGTEVRIELKPHTQAE